MQQFIPMTDELIERPPRRARLVPYQVDLPCFRWAVVTETERDSPATDSRPSRLRALRPAAEPSPR